MVVVGGNLKKLKSKNFLRVRTGQYWIIYTVRDDILLIMIVKIGARKDVFRNLTLKWGTVYLFNSNCRYQRISNHEN